MTLIEITLNKLIKAGIIPTDELFDITENVLNEYISHYNNGNISGKGNYRLARKLAGLNLLNLNQLRGGKFTDTKAGLVYLIENPAFPEHYKLGMTIDLVKRLASYQTYDPYRSFKVAKYEFVLDRRQKEKEFKQHPNIFLEQGEWVRRDSAQEIFNKIVTIGF